MTLLSFAFYSTWNVLCCVPLLITALVDFNVGLAIERARK